MKKGLLILITIIIACQLTGCSLIINPKIDYGNSKIYSKEDMDEAIKITKKEFFKSFSGSKLNNIRYISDDECGIDELKWLNNLEQKNDSKEVFTECALLLTDFHSSKNGNGVLEPEHDYFDWQWWLARTEKGKWKLVTNGWG